MASSIDLLHVYQRIENRINTGVENYELILNIIQKRSEIAEKISNLLLGIIPSKFDNNDPLQLSLIEDIKMEAKMNLTMSQQLKNTILIPSKTFSKTQEETQKQILKSMYKESKDLDKGCKTVEKYSKELENEKLKLNSIESNKRESQQKKVLKIKQEYQEKLENVEMLASKIQSSTLPIHHKDFSNFDNKRLSTTQKYVYTFTDLKLKMNQAENEFLNKSIEKLNLFDSKDRSDRFVTQTFDPTKRNLDENQEIFAFAIADYFSEDLGDLNFVRGDKIKVLLQHSSGWWDGEINGSKGTFPSTFVEIPGQKINKIEYLNTTLNVIKDFRPNQGKDIELIIGDFVYVETLENNICTGTNLRTNKHGTFPYISLEDKK